MNPDNLLNYLFIENDIRVYNTHYLFMKIYNREIGISKPTYFIAEIGSNFDGDLGRAKKLIESQLIMVQMLLNFSTIQLQP